MKKVSWTIYGRTVHHLLEQECKRIKKMKREFLRVYWDGNEVVDKLIAIDQQAMSAAEIEFKE